METKLKDFTEVMTKLETDIETMQNTLSLSSGIPAEARGQLSKELEFKSKIFSLCSERLSSITEFVKSSI